MTPDAATLADLSVVLVSNRGPVSFYETDHGFVSRRGAGGLAGAINNVAKELGDRATWIAAAMSEADRKALACGESKRLRESFGYNVDLLDIDPEIYAQYYDNVSNRMLWFANHNLWDEVGIERFGEAELDAWEHAYKPVNRHFAEMTAKYAGSEALVLFQDYHLTLAPGYLRELRPDQTILHFTHSSFATSEGLDRLPSPIPRAVIEGMLGADLIGFHIISWVDGFLDCCEHIGARVDAERGLVEHGGRRSWVRAYPIPIDADGLRRRVTRKKAESWKTRLQDECREWAKGECRIVVRADRVEFSKNVVRGFEAFGQLLDRRADLRRSLRFIACLYPSRKSMAEYQEYQERIEAAAEAVNRRYPGSIDLYMKNDYDRTLAAMRLYDVLLVNPIMDGMNLVSKEGPAVNENDGAVVLTTGAGSYEELGHFAVEISDPFDVAETSAALERALDLSPGARARRAAGLRRQVDGRNPEDWIEAQLADLRAIKSDGKPVTPARSEGSEREHSVGS